MWSLGIFIFALILRLLYIFQIKSADPLFYHPALDALYHHDWAVSIIKGGWLGKDSFFRAPLYPYFLSLLCRIFGINFLIPRIVQSLIGSLNCVLIQKIGNKLFDKKVGNIAGIITAFYPLFIYFDNELLLPSLLIFFILFGFFSILKQNLDKSTNLGWFITGLGWGLAAITRPNVILFLIILPFWFYRKMKKDFLRVVLYSVMGVLSMIIPVTIRNYVVSKEFVPIAWQGGTNFYIGNNPYSTGMTAVIPGTRETWWGTFYDAKKIAEQAIGRKLKNSEIDRYWFNQGLEFIKNEPVKTFYLFLKKTYLFFGGFEVSSERDIYFFTKLTYLKFLIFALPFFQFPFGLIFPLALIGCWYAFKRKQDISLLLVFIITYSLSFIIFFVCARYRLAIIPFLIMLAGFAIVAFIDELKRGKIKNSIVVLTVFVVFFIFFNANIFQLKPVNPALSYFTLADAEFQKRNYQRTIFYLEKSLNYMPNYAEALNLLGVTYKQIGKPEKALFYYQAAIESDPILPDPYSNIGNIYAEAGEYVKANDFYLKAIEIDPFSARTYNNLGNVSYIRKDFKNALAYYEKASQLEPNFVFPLYHAGLVYLELGNMAKAESLWIKVLNIEPGHVSTQEALKSFLGKD